MTLHDCLNKRVITQEYDSINIKYQGVNYTIKIGDICGRLEVIKLVQFLEGTTKRKGCICKCECGNYIGPSRLHTITEWTRITGLSWSTINRRLKAGKTVGQALGYEK